MLSRAAKNVPMGLIRFSALDRVQGLCQLHWHTCSYSYSYSYKGAWINMYLRSKFTKKNYFATPCHISTLFPSPIKWRASKANNLTGLETGARRARGAPIRASAIPMRPACPALMRTPPPGLRAPRRTQRANVSTVFVNIKWRKFGYCLLWNWFI